MLLGLTAISMLVIVNGDGVGGGVGVGVGVGFAVAVGVAVGDGPRPALFPQATRAKVIRHVKTNQSRGCSTVFLCIHCLNIFFS
jgi:hypothetical protein